MTSTSGSFGTIIADPPWAYQKTTRHAKLTGYSDAEYSPLSTADLCALPVGALAHDASVLALWTTFPFVPDALRLIDAWGFTYVTGLPWVKVTKSDRSKPEYGVGYWFRGAAELILVGKRKKAYRTNFTGLISENFGHSRKPDDLYALCEGGFPGPYLELFARRTRPGWTQLGNELPGHEGEDIRDALARINPDVE